MNHERVVQPSVPKPDYGDSRAWAVWPIVLGEWMKSVGPQLQIDTDTFLLGNALKNIIGDDANSFGAFRQYVLESVETAKESIYMRMDWEIRTSQLPSTIREQLIQVKQQMKSMDWVGEENFAYVRETWRKKVSHFTKHQIALHKELREAIQYNDSVINIWTPYWNVFIQGKK